MIHHTFRKPKKSFIKVNAKNWITFSLQSFLYHVIQLIYSYRIWIEFFQYISSSKPFCQQPYTNNLNSQKELDHITIRRHHPSWEDRQNEPTYESYQQRHGSWEPERRQMRNSIAAVHHGIEPISKTRKQVRLIKYNYSILFSETGPNGTIQERKRGGVLVGRHLVGSPTLPAWSLKSRAPSVGPVCVTHFSTSAQKNKKKKPAYTIHYKGK